MIQSRLRAVEEGVRHNYENPDMLKSRQLPLFGWASPIAVLVILFSPTPFDRRDFTGIALRRKEIPHPPHSKSGTGL